MKQSLWSLLIISILGIFFLLFLTRINSPEEIAIKDISKDILNKEVVLQVKIVNLRDFPKSNFQILTLEDQTGNITATSNSATQLKINKSKVYLITGIIQEYKNEIQLSINKIIEK